MSQSLDTSKLILLRKITRAISDLLGKELKLHLSTLSPLMQPRDVFGQHLGSVKQTIKGEADAFEEVRTIYQSLAKNGPFSLPKELDQPLDIVNTSPEITPADYPHQARTDQDGKTVTVTSPLKWVLSYSGFGPKRLRELVANKDSATGNQLQQCVIHFLVMHVTLARRPGLKAIFEALRFPVLTGIVEEFGELPITYLECQIETLRPDDEIIIESTEISGTPAFEEVVPLEAIENLQDPLEERLLEIVKNYDAGLLADAD